MKLPALLSGVMIIAAPPAYAGAPPQAETRPGTLSFQLDNDLYAGEDRDYTNGSRLLWISDPMEGVLGGAGAEGGGEMSRHYGFSITQLIFTPEDYAAHHQPPGERRYAGWLGLGFSLHLQEERTLHSLVFTLGTTGPNSLAEHTQNAVHEMRSIEKFDGWTNQVPNEVTADVSFTQRHRQDMSFMDCGGFSMDGSWEWGARLGSFRTSAHLATTLRGGFHLTPDFSDLRLSESGFSHRRVDTLVADDKGWSAYFLVGAMVRGVAHDATLDGPLFRDFVTGNTREPIVADVFVGMALACRGVELSYVHTWRSREYKEQEEISEYGSIGIRFRF